MDTDIPLDGLQAGLSWIHAGASPSELSFLQLEANERLAECEPAYKFVQTPLAAWLGGQRVAGSYFKLLSGNVATLGGARATLGWEQSAADLIVRQINLASDLGIPQIQAIVRADDLATAELVQLAGMTCLTEIEHLWLDVLAAQNLAASASAAAISGVAGRSSSQSKVGWLPATDLAHGDLAQFIDETFTDTLDCPALNGRRTPVEVLDGLLDGLPLSAPSLHWELLELDTTNAGCLFLQLHDSDPMELVYMGLVPAARGRRLGRLMVARAIETAHRRGCTTLVVAVDRDNWPALNAYRDWGFQSHQRLQVWLAAGS